MADMYYITKLGNLHYLTAKCKELNRENRENNFKEIKSRDNYCIYIHIDIYIYIYIYITTH